MKLEEIASNGNRLSTLKALRSKIASAIDDTTSGRDIAALSLRLMDIIDQINDLEGNNGDELDELIDDSRIVRPVKRQK